MIRMFLLISNKLLIMCFHVTVQQDAEVSGVQLSNGMPRQTAPLPFSPPQPLDVSTLDQVDQGGKFCFSVLSYPTHPYLYMISCQN